MNFLTKVRGAVTRIVLALALVSSLAALSAAQTIETQSQGRHYGEPGFRGEPIDLNVVNADIRQREITNVLQGLQDSANNSRMVVMRFAPRDDTTQDSIIAKPVEVEVDSNFNQLRAFFDSMAKLPRIVSITDFKINQLDKQSDSKTLHAQFLLTAYYAAPTDLNAKPALPGAPGTAKPGTPAPAPGAPVTAPAAPVAK
jgi:hypothetical protein